MEEIRRYIISVTVAALASGIALSLCAKSIYKKEITMICGLFMICTLLHPLLGVSLPELPDLDTYLQQAEAAAQEGKRISDEAQCDIISEECQSYIVDKGSDLQETLSVSVTVENIDGSFLPVYAEIYGCSSVKNKEILSKVITDDLGIQKENQRWICR